MAIRYTNKFNIPQEFVDAITTDNHVVNGDISVTTLIDSPQIRQLKRTHDYEVDVTDQIAMFFGTAIHEKLETSHPQFRIGRMMVEVARFLRKSKPDNEVFGKVSDWLIKKGTKLIEAYKQKVFIEQTLTTEIDGWVVSGTLDRYIKEKKKIRDYKTITASQLMFPEQKKSWYLQQNIYASMLREQGYEVDSIEICAIVKDWSKMKILSSADYPKSPIIIIPIQIADEQEVRDYMKKRIEIHNRAENGEAIPCTKEDRWAKEDTYAVKKKGNKKALKCLSSEQLAKHLIEELSVKYNRADLSIEYRPSESFRCKHYCAVSSVCPQYRHELDIQAKLSSETF